MYICTVFSFDTYQLKLRLKALAVQMVLSGKSFRMEDHFILFCSPRSGSTWLMDLLQHIPQTATLWEPLHLTKGILQDAKELGWRPYIPMEEQNDLIEQRLEQLFSGRLINPWLVKQSSIFDFAMAHRFIIKFVRAQALIPWIMERFHFEYDPLVLLRHPIPMALSQMKAFSQTKKIRCFKQPVDISYNSIYKNHFDYLQLLNDPLEFRIAKWAILHTIPRSYMMNRSCCIVVHYEDLLLHPEREINRIFNHWNLPVPEELFTSVDRRSTTDFKGDLKHDPVRQIEKWLPEIGKTKRKRIQDIFDYFEISSYNAHDPYPKDTFFIKS